MLAGGSIESCQAAELKLAHHAVFQHISTDSLLLEPTGHLYALVVIVQPAITTSWTDDYGDSIEILRRRKGFESHRVAMMGGAVPDMDKSIFVRHT